MDRDALVEKLHSLPKTPGVYTFRIGAANGTSPDAETPKGIDLTPKEMDRSQAAIDLDKGEGPDGMSEVIRVAKPGDSKSTQDILAQAQQRFRRKLRRESLVSALTKKVLDGQTFVRTAPNTFDLLHREGS